MDKRGEGGEGEWMSNCAFMCWEMTNNELWRKMDVYSKGNEARWVTVVQPPSLRHTLPSFLAAEDYQVCQLTDTWGILLINTLDCRSSACLLLWFSGGFGHKPRDRASEVGMRRAPAGKGDAGVGWHGCSSSGRLHSVCIRAGPALCIDALIMVCRWVTLFKWAVTCAEAQGLGDSEQTLVISIKDVAVSELSRLAVES